MLTRILAALVMLPLALYAILFTSVEQFQWILAGVLALAAWEWSRLAQLHNPMLRLLFVAVLLAIYTGFVLNPVSFWYWLLPAMWVWVATLIWLPDFPESRFPLRAWMVALQGAVLLPAAMLALWKLHGDAQLGPYWVLFVLAVSWVADSGAYFVGRRFGKRKLAPNLSPGKTWEGVFGGNLAALLFAFAFAPLLLSSPYEPQRLMLLLLFAVLLSGVSVLGDLLESAFKRNAGVKDSGALIPGHGGILDRIDSQIATAPIGLLMFILAGWAT
jgi:phosphatidate cytidylyltransferase